MGKFTDLDEALEELGYGNQWSAQIETLAVREAEKRASDIERLNDYNKRNPEKHKEAVKRAVLSRTEAARSLVELAEKLYGKLLCKHCSKELTATEFTKYRCSKCKKLIKEKTDEY